MFYTWLVAETSPGLNFVTRIFGGRTCPMPVVDGEIVTLYLKSTRGVANQLLRGLSVRYLSMSLGSRVLAGMGRNIALLVKVSACDAIEMWRTAGA
ncbi:hypothetical protein DSO57_1038070 [Entomophthora muscae]|uniref:Uncharacterized protein n=1 Tax=Entomophthora muscae TaxID=34485 RepID=A0ACC2RDH6_9FUNG|nr:hypothetical protein DSO57_1038070 [Entomophthora muscae]